LRNTELKTKTEWGRLYPAERNSLKKAGDRDSPQRPVARNRSPKQASSQLRFPPRSQAEDEKLHVQQGEQGQMKGSRKIIATKENSGTEKIPKRKNNSTSTAL
jgi:hypothetical protein